jgi:hypothetical protein
MMLLSELQGQAVFNPLAAFNHDHLARCKAFSCHYGL